MLSKSQRGMIRPPVSSSPEPMPDGSNTIAEVPTASNEDPLLSLLVVSPDPELRKDMMICFERLFDARTAWLDAETLSRGYDLALKRRPVLAMFDLRADALETLRVVARIHEQ